MRADAASADNTGGADLVSWALAVLVVLAGAVWAGAQLSVLVVHQRSLPVNSSEVITALLRLPDTASHPALAWPAAVRALIPGPLVVWPFTVLVCGGALVALVAVQRLFAGPGVGTEPRRRLGVDTQARLARTRDLTPLIVKGPSSGRFVLGMVGRRLVATERPPIPGQRRRRPARSGDRSAVCVIGPTRCGKTANAISGILDWEGPAILSSVRDDLLRATIERRKELGDVLVFDPTGSTGLPCARWSPLRNASTPTGAQQAARGLASTIPRSDRTVDFFTGRAEELLWPLLYAAAVSNKTMADVLKWVLTADQPTGKSRGEVASLLDVQRTSADPKRRAGAAAALNALRSIWSKDHRTASSVYITAQGLLAPFQDPMVAASANAQVGGVDLNLDWLVSGSNTLYICSPLHEQARLAPLFGGLLSDLVEQQAYERVARTRKPLHDLLVVLDEAANTPTRWLPNVASTCSGLGILLVTIWQSKAQIDAAYGRLADGVMTNHGTKIIFSGVSDLATLDYVNRLVGDEEVTDRASSRERSGGLRSLNESTTRVPLLPADLLRRVAPGQGLLIHGTLPPAHLRSRPYYAKTQIKELPTLKRSMSSHVS